MKKNPRDTGGFSMRYLGIVFLVLGTVIGLLIGSLIPLGQGRATVIGCVVGILLGALLLDWTRRKEKKMLLDHQEAQKLRGQKTKPKWNSGISGILPGALLLDWT